MLLTGYAPSASAISAISAIATDLQTRSSAAPGSLFWILDPVMGDQGRLYVSEDVVPMYKSLISRADLILPNQFEAETLSGQPITDLKSLTSAMEILHQQYCVPHVVVTSLTFPSLSDERNGTIAVAGSSRTSLGKPRLFVIHVPKLNCFFSGTGDMFAALMVVRMREAAIAAGIDSVGSWMSPDAVEATELPLAKAVEVVLAGMGLVLAKTMEARNEEMREFDGNIKIWENGDADGKRRYLAETKAAEVRVVRNIEMLRNPVVRCRAQKVEV